jgi:dipeptidase D
MEDILMLKPAPMWRHFCEISRIPRCSGQEEQVRNYVVSVAEDNGAEYRIDRAGNLVVKSSASPGLEGAPVIVLQSHLDMVCEKNKDSSHDFSKDPLVLQKEGPWVFAEGTTLGGDNGVGVAAALAVLEDASLPHGPLELLFTVDEESGLTGASALEPDMLVGRKLINLDTEEHGSLYIGCAGGRDTALFLEARYESITGGYRPLQVKLGGLQGGHSGIDIHEQRGNAVKLLNRFLWKEASRMGFRLVDVEGGSKHNAIPRESEAVVLVPPDNEEEFRRAITAYERNLRDELGPVDPGVFVAAETFDVETKRVLSAEDQERLLHLLDAIPHGVITMSKTVPELVQTSTNLAVVRTEPAGIRVLTSQRSSVDSELEDISNRVAAVGREVGAQVEPGTGYPPWTPDMSSELLRTARQVFQQVFGSEPQVKAVHAGLECGIIGAKFEEMDMISFGPTILGAHSPSERLNVPSVESFWAFLAAMLRALAG